MKRKSLAEIDKCSIQLREQNNNTNDFVEPSNINVFDSFQNFSSLQLQDTARQCRICLQQAYDMSHNFVSPCNCSGSLKFVHETCLLLWIARLYASKSKAQQKTMKSKGLPCQICKKRIYLNFQNVYQCLNQEEISKRVNSNLVIFTILIVFETIVLISLGFIIFIMIGSKDSFGKDIISTLIVVCALGLLIAAIILSLYYLITRFCIETTSKLLSYSLKSPLPKMNNKRKIAPMEMNQS